MQQLSEEYPGKHSPCSSVFSLHSVQKILEVVKSKFIALFMSFEDLFSTTLIRICKKITFYIIISMGHVTTFTRQPLVFFKKGYIHVVTTVLNYVTYCILL